jgi:hypothetical protein
MKKQPGPLLSRREFTQRAAMLSATATIAPAEVMLSKSRAGTSPQNEQDESKATTDSQSEIDSHYQQILNLYGSRFDEAQKANLKKMCADLRPPLERVRNFTLENGDAAALYLKPLVEREKKPRPGDRSGPTSVSKKS